MRLVRLILLACFGRYALCGTFTFHHSQLVSKLPVCDDLLTSSLISISLLRLYRREWACPGRSRTKVLFMPPPALLWLAGVRFLMLERYFMRNRNFAKIRIEFERTLASSYGDSLSEIDGQAPHEVCRMHSCRGKRASLEWNRTGQSWAKVAPDHSLRGPPVVREAGDRGLEVTHNPAHFLCSFIP